MLHKIRSSQSWSRWDNKSNRVYRSFLEAMPWEYLLDIGLLQAGDQGAQDMKAVLEGCSDMKHSHQNKLDRLFYTQTYYLPTYVPVK